MQRKYEAVVIFDPDLDDGGVQQQLDRIQSIVKNHEGVVEKQDIWGRKPLGYPIKKKEYGVYTLLTFNGDNTLVADLRRQLRITDVVLRSFVTKKDKFAPDLTQASSGEASVEKFASQDKAGGDFGEDGPDDAAL